MPDSLDVDDISIDMDQCTLRATVGGGPVVIDLLREPGKRALGLIRELMEEIRSKTATGGEDNCDSCTGRCCAEGWVIRVSRADVQRMAKGLGVGEGDVIGNYLETNSEVDSRFPFQMRQVKDDVYGNGKRCGFLQVKMNEDGHPTGRCGIWQHRPDVCRDHPAHGCEFYVPATNLLRKLREPTAFKSIKKYGR